MTKTPTNKIDLPARFGARHVAPAHRCGDQGFLQYLVPGRQMQQNAKWVSASSKVLTKG
jgi:hypothetical protein